MPVPDSDWPHLPSLWVPIINEGQGGEEEREHWTKIGGHELWTSGSNVAHKTFFWLEEHFKSFHI